MTRLKKSVPKLKLSFEAIGTSWEISVAMPVELAGNVSRVIADRIDMFDAVYSRFRSDSLVTQINKKPGTYLFPADAEKLFRFYRWMYERTHGRVTPLIGSLLSDAGYDATYSLKPHKLSPVQAWDTVMNYSQGELTVSSPVLLDFGAAGKGYLVDIICGVLEQYGVKDYCVDAGGDMRAQGDELMVGLEHPLDRAMAIGSIKLKNKSICGSAGNRRQWGSYHHILDPSTMRPVSEIAAVWVIADSAMIADGLTTCLYLEPHPARYTDYDFEYVILFSDGRVGASATLKPQLFTS